jgi:hypothetical protein
VKKRAAPRSSATGPRDRPGRPDARDRRILELERENQRLKACAEALAELQERVSKLLGIPLEREAKE